MELDNDQKLAIVQNVISADNNYRLPQNLRRQHADKILENLL